MKKIIVPIQPDLHKMVKQLALDSNTSMSDIVRDLLRQRLAMSAPTDGLPMPAGSILSKTD